MKTASALLIAALLLLTTPILATAHDGDRHTGGEKYYKSWVKDRHEADHYRHNQKHKWERRAKNHFKQHRREHRRDHRYIARYYNRPYYAKPAVVYGFPQIVFHVDW